MFISVCLSAYKLDREINLLVTKMQTKMFSYVQRLNHQCPIFGGILSMWFINILQPYFPSYFIF